MNIDKEKARYLFNKYATPVMPKGCAELDFGQFVEALQEYIDETLNIILEESPNVTQNHSNLAIIDLNCGSNIPRLDNHHVWYCIFGKLERETPNAEERNKPNISGKIGLPLDAPEMSKIHGHSMLSADGRWIDKLYVDGELIAQWIDPQPTDAEAMA